MKMDVRLRTYNFGIVKEYTYLGTLMTNELPEAENRIRNASNAYDALLLL
jgi:hypothetical protein